MKRIRQFFYEKASIKAFLITAGLTVICVITNLLVYVNVFLPATNGTAYMELNMGYLPADLYEFAAAYGEQGRKLYITMSATLDLAVPFLGGLLSIWAAMLLSRAAHTETFITPALLLGAGCCLSDWGENVCMMTVLAAYPASRMSAAVGARIFTACKYILMIALLAVLVVLAVKAIRRRKKFSGNYKEAFYRRIRLFLEKGER